MKSFFQWAEEKNLELPIVTDQEAADKNTVDEKTARAGFAHWAYPDLYVRSHYPDGYFMPRAADAKQKMGDHDPFHSKHKVLDQVHPSMK
jgi:hypothetical protein